MTHAPATHDERGPRAASWNFEGWPAAKGLHPQEQPFARLTISRVRAGDFYDGSRVRSGRNIALYRRSGDEDGDQLLEGLLQ